MEAQIQQLTHFAETKGYQIVGKTSEYATGTDIARPGLQEVANAVRAGQVDIVIVYSPSRISRQMTMTNKYIRFLHRHNVALLSVNDGLEFTPHEAKNTPYLAWV